MVARCLEPDVIRNNHVIQTALAHAFCHLIGSVEDINASVAQRAMMFLETIRPAALKVSDYKSCTDIHSLCIKIYTVDDHDTVACRKPQPYVLVLSSMQKPTFQNVYF